MLRRARASHSHARFDAFNSRVLASLTRGCLISAQFWTVDKLSLCGTPARSDQPDFKCLRQAQMPVLGFNGSGQSVQQADTIRTRRGGFW
jgi:hypothetical protein